MKIRKFAESDYQNLYETISDPDVMRFIEAPYSEENTRKFLQTAGLCENPLIYAVENDQGNYVGYVIYHDYDNGNKEIGWILKRAEWDKGYAKALTRLLIKKTGHEGKGVVIECAPEQDITKHIATSLGFTYQGITDGCCVYMLNGEDE